MKLRPIEKYQKWIQGSAPLPAGAVPLAAESSGLICLMPTGRWIMWLGGVMRSRPQETQKYVMEVVVEKLGGTAASTADHLEVSPRTVEAWRSGKARLPINQAYQIAVTLEERNSKAGAPPPGRSS